MNTELMAFYNQKYLNLETFRRNGLGVRTPVWFVQEGDTLFIRTAANSGKIRRIRNNAEVNIAPCKMDGVLLGAWQPAVAHEVNDQVIDDMVNHLLGTKYGLLKKIFYLAGNSKKRKYSILELKVSEKNER